MNNSKPVISKLIEDTFCNITEPRDSNKRHKLIDIITISICAVICGAEGWEHIEEFGHAKYDWFRKFLELPHGIPSNDTVRRVFTNIDPVEFRESFMSWVHTIYQSYDGQIIVIDGKTLRRSHDKGIGKTAIHMVSAWALANGIVLGQIKTDEKSNEITAIPELLKALEIEGGIVTIDAMGCQKKIAKKIIDKGADYVLALKGNQSRLHDNIKLFFEDSFEKQFHGLKVNYHKTTDGEHGRVEIRRYWTTSDIDWLQGKEFWERLHTIGMVQRERHVDGKISIENSYYICSIENNVELFAQTVRGHWSIESFHWILDVTFREDES